MSNTYNTFEKRLDEMEAKRKKQQEEAMDAAFRKAEKRRKKKEQQRAEAKRQQNQKEVPVLPPPPTINELQIQTLQILGLRADQNNPVAIRSAYRRLALRHHPDKNPSKDTTDIFRKILEAYQMLTGCGI